MHALRILALLVLAASCCNAATSRDKAEAIPAADPVAKLETQDFAFSLLIETYRQFQNNLIESDYQIRLSGAGSLTI